MKQRIERTINRLVEKLNKWDAVDTITLAPSAEIDYLDPYFFISLDVFYKKELPSVEERRNTFPEGLAFESSCFQTKDRFMVEDIPVRIEYKSIEKIDDMLRNLNSICDVNTQNDTYLFYRIDNNSVLSSKSDWLTEVQRRIHELPERFWESLVQNLLATMDHYRSDLGAAVVRGDNYFSLVASAGFIKSACAVLFAINKEFQPSPRVIYERVLELNKLPQDFRGRFDSFLRNDVAISSERRAEIGELMAKSIIKMVYV